MIFLPLITVDQKKKKISSLSIVLTVTAGRGAAALIAGPSLLLLMLVSHCGTHREVCS